MLNEPSLADLAAALEQFIRERKEEAGYEGEIDSVGHCMGTFVSRYMREVLAREAQNLEVRQLIGLGQPNNGSSAPSLPRRAPYLCRYSVSTPAP
jgi:triacylglycerol lipase